MSTLEIHTEPVPISQDGDGVLRVGESRVTLDVVVRAYEGGAEPKEIVRAYPTLRLADVYNVVAYYLRHRDEVDDYLRRRREEAEALEKEIRAAWPKPDDIRARLLARKAQPEAEHAPSGD